MNILAKFALLTLGSGLCYWGVINADRSTTRVGVYLGFDLIIDLVLTIGRRMDCAILRELSTDARSP
ncbi:hypothetical protein [Psychrobacter sp. DM4]|uniref:hypothetical protein n=1 Tax=Psychrobacter sp. DM4 TaxID=3440637 RepID=UPI003F4FBC1F